MEISFDERARLTLEVVEVLPPPPYRGAIALSVVVLDATVMAPDFQGRRRFQVAAPVLEQLVADLEALERSRSGIVHFDDDDYGAFSLTVSAADGAGHLALSADLKWGAAFAGDRWERLLSVAEASVDPSDLPHLVQATRQLWDGVVALHQGNS